MNMDLTKTKIAITGATGLLGSHLLQQGSLKNRFFSVLLRNPENVTKRSYLYEILKESPPTLNPIELVPFDLLSSVPPPEFIHPPTPQTPHLPILIHAAAFSSLKKEHTDLIWRTNYEGTKNVFNFALQRGLKKWIQISSISTLCDGSGEKLVNEFFHGQVRPTEYAQSKLAADLWLKEECKKHDIELLTIYPCYMLGPYDARPSSGAIILGIYLNKIRHYIDNMKNFVSARDVAIGIWQAIDSHVAGDYILGNENIKISDFLKMICDRLNRPFDLIPLQTDNFENTLANNTTEDKVSSQELQFIREVFTASSVSSAKAQKTFYYDPKEKIENYLTETIDWFLNQKMIKEISLNKKKPSFLSKDKTEDLKRKILHLVDAIPDLKTRKNINLLDLNSTFRNDFSYDSIAMVSFLCELQAVWPELSELNEDVLSHWRTLGDCIECIKNIISNNSTI